MSTNRGGLAHLVIIYISLPLLVYAQTSFHRNPVIFNFGDSLSDTGGYVAGTGYAYVPPYGRTFFHRPAGRKCDGRVLIDFLCESLNTSLLRPYLKSEGLNFTNGANFAVYDARASTLPTGFFFNLGVQVLQFFQFQAHSIELTAEGCKNFVGEEGFKNALYIVDIGGNDLMSAFSNLPYALAIQRVPYYIADIKQAILNLYHRGGGRKFWIPNSHPIGCLPGVLASLSYNASDLDPHGCLRPLNELVTIFNDELRALTEDLRSELGNATIVYVDIYAIRFDLIINANIYGFETPLMACCGYGGPPYNYNSSIDCGEPGYNVCEEGSRYVNWDGYHFTEVANAITAAKVLTTEYNTPPLNFDFFVTQTCSEYKLKRNAVLNSSQ